MKLSVRQLLSANTALGNLVPQKLPVPTVFLINRLADQIAPEMGNAVSAHNSVRRQFVENDAQEMPPEKMAEFTAELQPLLDAVVDLSFEPLPLSSLSKATITSPELRALQPFIDTGK